MEQPNGSLVHTLEERKARLTSHGRYEVPEKNLGAPPWWRSRTEVFGCLSWAVGRCHQPNPLDYSSYRSL